RSVRNRRRTRKLGARPGRRGGASDLDDREVLALIAVDAVRVPDLSTRTAPIRRVRLPGTRDVDQESGELGDLAWPDVKVLGLPTGATRSGTVHGRAFASEATISLF